jgi:hypothetical protein
MKLKKRCIYVPLLLGLFIAACSDKVIEKPFISPPFSALNQTYTDFSFNAENGDTLLFTSGSRIIVPPDIWVDSAGNKITGKINLKYREFSDAGDVFLAGIPLAYDTAGRKENLTTAGMFEIRSFKDSSEIFIADNKSLTVQMASNETNADYNFYFLDEDAKNWQYIGTNTPTENPKIQEIKDTIATLQPEMPFPFDKSYFALNYDAILDVYYKDNYYQIEKNYKSKLPKRKAESYGLSYSGIYCRYQLTYKGVRYEAYQMVWQLLSGTKLPRIAKSCYTEKLTYLGNNTYNMLLVKDKKKTNIQVKAVMPMKHLFAYPPETWKEKYDEVMAKITEEEKRLASQFAVYRTFEVGRTGYFNWDRIMKMKDNIMVNSEFKFDKEIEGELADIDIFYFVDNNKSFTKIRYSSTDSIMIAPDSTAKFIAVLSDTEAAFFSTEDYNKINFEKLRKSQAPSYTFKMKSVPITSRDDFEKLISMK